MLFSLLNYSLYMLLISETIPHIDNKTGGADATNFGSSGRRRRK